MDPLRGAAVRVQIEVSRAWAIHMRPRRHVLQIRRRRATARLVKPTRTPLPLSSFLSSLRTTVGNSVDDFLTLGDVLRLRGCTSGLAVQYHPSQSSRLWDRIRPPLNVLHCVASNLTADAATLIECSFAGDSKMSIRRAIVAVACVTGNIALAEWGLRHIPPPGNWIDRGRIADSFRDACRHGHAELADWLMTRFGLSPSTIPTYLLICARMADNIAMAQWLMDIGYIPAANEDGCALFIGACCDDNMRFARWVLRTLPFTIDCSRLTATILELCCRVPRGAQFLIETFDVPWADIANIYPGMVKRLDGIPECSSLRKWLVARYGADSAIFA